MSFLFSTNLGVCFKLWCQKLHCGYFFNLRERKRNSIDSILLYPQITYLNKPSTPSKHMYNSNRSVTDSLYIKNLCECSVMCGCVNSSLLLLVHLQLCTSKVWVWSTFLSQSLLLRALWILCSTLTSSHLSIKVSDAVMSFTLHFPFILLYRVLLCLYARSLQLSCWCVSSYKHATCIKSSTKKIWKCLYVLPFSSIKSLF